MAKILAVDDRAINLEFLSTLLAYVGHEVLTASDGAEALQIVRAQHPDLVITDVMMPTMGGVEFADLLHDDPDIAQTPIIFYTATYRVTEARVLGKSCNVSAVLAKPAEPQEILNAVADALGTEPAPALVPDSFAGHVGFIGTKLPAYLRDLTELQKRLRRTLDQGIEQGEAAASREADTIADSFHSLSLRVAALLELDLALSSERDPQTMLNVFCSGAQSIMGSRFAAIGLIGADGRRLERIATRGLSDDVHAQLATTDPVFGIFRSIVASTTPYRAKDETGNASTLGLPAFHPPVTSLLAVPVPVRSASSLTGWVYFADTLSGHAFNSEDEQLAVTLAGQFALAYGNLRLYDEVQQHAARLEIEIAERRRAGKALSESEERFRQMAENINDVFYLVESDGSSVYYLSPAFTQIWGISPATLYAHPTAWIDFIHPEDRDRVIPIIMERMPAGLGFDVEYRIVRPDKALRWVRVRSFPIADETGKTQRTAGIATDITESKRLTDELRESDRRLSDMLANVDLIAVMLDRENHITYCNESLLKKTGWQREEVLGRDWFELFVPPGNEHRKQAFLSYLKEETIATREENEILTRTGERLIVRWNDTLLRSAAGDVIGAASICEDVTEERRAQAELAHSLTHDRTTGLPRFVLLEEYLQTAFVEAAAHDSRVIVFYVDIDRFNTINETRGRAVGDQVLQIIAERLRAMIGDDGRVAHVAGDEFALVLKDPARVQDQVEYGEAIRSCIEAPMPIEDHPVYATCSIGVSCFPDNGSSPDELLRQAESGMLHAKREGRNAVVSFANEYKQELDDRLSLGLKLRDALRAEQLILHYQPRIDSQDWRVCGFEALLRWQNPDLGLLLPGRFLPVAEDLGVMVDIGKFVLDSACKQARTWIDGGADHFTISINVSPVQMQRPVFVDEVRAALKRWGLPAHYIELELVESMMAGNINRVIGVMRALKALGVTISLDDFGTGYSSLNYLRRFPIDTLKIDQSLVQDISTDAGAAGICRAVITLGHQLGMKVVAEGVETAAQVGYLRRNECDYFQGFFFGKAASAAQALEILRRSYMPQAELEPHLDPSGLLLVDDEANILQALTRVLRRDGYRIFTANGGEEALDILGRNDIQVVISDQRMPGISGTQLLSKIKEMYPHTVRMVLSGYTDLAAITESINEGAIYKFLTKPWNDEELRQQVRDAFRIVHRRRKQTKIDSLL